MDPGGTKSGSGGAATPSSKSAKPAKFAVYQNGTFSAALTETSRRPSPSTVFFLFSLSSASAFAFFTLSSRQSGIAENFKMRILSDHLGYFITRVIQLIMGVIFMGTSLAFLKALHRQRLKISEATRVFDGTKEEARLTDRQLGLLGIQPKTEKAGVDMSRRPPKSQSPMPSTASEPLIPLHQPVFTPNRTSRLGADMSSSSAQRMQAFGTPSKSQISPSSAYLVSPSSAQMSSTKTSPGLVSTPWSNKRASPSREIITEEELERFLADVDRKITSSAEKQATPNNTKNGFRISSPSSISNSANTGGTTRTTPLRSVRMSPGSQKFTTPPKKGEGEFPSPMSMEELLEALEILGVYPEIEEWRDNLRQWFSSMILNPLLWKIEASHTQVMQSAQKLGVSITLSPIGNDSLTSTTPIAIPVDQSKDWQPALSLDEDGILHQLRASLVQVLDASQKSPIGSLQQSPQQNALLPIARECVDFITEHQRLQTLMKGELIKGLLPQSSVPAEFTVQRVRELAEGTCLKNYEYTRSGEISDKVRKKWTIDVPSDSHLLFYLFCAFLEYPKWMMLHSDPASYSGAQSSKNPLFLGVLPPKERFPEKYIAIVSSVPSTLHPGACVLAMGRQNPPIFALYRDKKFQFALQGRTALWDSILLLCHRIKTGYGGFVRGIHLGSSALNILPVLESGNED